MSQCIQCVEYRMREQGLRAATPPLFLGSNMPQLLLACPKCGSETEWHIRKDGSYYCGKCDEFVIPTRKK